MLKLLSEAAPAKINFWLRVVGRRPNGYHELDSIFMPIPICDRVGLGLRPATSAAVWLRCDHPGLGPESSNLAVRAAHAFMNEFGVSAEVMIDLHKVIPAGAGLGGGSSDAGAVLRMMTRLYGISDHARLARAALTLGADVPFFLAPATARVRGIGELIERLDGLPALNLVVAVPPINVSTADVFKRLSRDQWSGRARKEDQDEIIAGRLTPTLLINDLAPVAMTLWPEIRALKATLEECGASGVSMSGSGGAVFGVFASRRAMREAALALKCQQPSSRVFAVAPHSALEID